VEADDKPAWRSRLLVARAAVPPDVRVAEASALARWVGELSGTVCAYVPIGSEPGSPAMLDALVAAGCRVLLPVVARGPAPLDRAPLDRAPLDWAPLDWAEYSGPAGLVPGGSGLGLLEPVGPRLGHAALGLADTVLVPALAVDLRGVRLGRGGGHYDRSLPLAAAGARLVGVVRDVELVARLPVEPHDVLMTAALTPSAGFTPLPRPRVSAAP